ncbi:MAG: hypothetical protein QF561_01740 [Phycisphaerales bacterium]|jgi:hypothetical protein|nr:hypothetical protein [Phycisphaerales bacterium]
MSRLLLSSVAGAPPAGPAEGDLTRVFLPLAIMAGLIVIAWLALVTVRRLRSHDSSGGGTFSLEELRRMKHDGTLSDDEFESAREALSGQHLRGKDRQG